MERSKVGGGGVQDVVLDLGVGGLGQVSLWTNEQLDCFSAMSHMKERKKYNQRKEEIQSEAKRR